MYRNSFSLVADAIDEAVNDLPDKICSIPCQEGVIVLNRKAFASFIVDELYNAMVTHHAKELARGEKNTSHAKRDLLIRLLIQLKVAHENKHAVHEKSDFADEEWDNLK